MVKEEEKGAASNSSRRAREFLQYAGTVASLRAANNDTAVKSSADHALTAYAQLVALRLKAKRGVISLFDRSSQYVLAEATQTLSLQSDIVHDKDDFLYWGCTILPRKNDFFSSPLKASETRDICDLTEHETYKDHPYVTNDPPIAQTFAAVPLLTPKSNAFALGMLAVMDDEPRKEGLGERALQFMRDVATTIMQHLDMQLTSVAHERGLRLVKGLGRFTEGKDSLDDDLNIRDGQQLNAYATQQGSQQAANTGSYRARALNRGSDEERYDVANTRHRDESSLTRASTAESERHSASALSERVHSDESDDGTVDQTARKFSPRQRAADQGTTISQASSPSRLRVKESNQSDVLSPVNQAFERGARLLLQSMELSGVLFLDASQTGSNQLKSDDNDSTASDRSDFVTQRSVSLGSSSRQICRLLGAAYDPNPGALHVDRTHEVSTGFLKSMINHAPNGTIFGFDDNENPLLSDELSDSSATTSSKNNNHGAEDADDEHQHHRPRKARWRVDHETIQQLFPGVRSLGIMPMWDIYRQRYSATAIIWTYSKTRIMSFQEDLNYLGAFCDVIIAEVGRLRSQAESVQKQRFMTSISHELRSPLHGILGGVECLQDAKDTQSNDTLLQMIDSSGRSLLDIVNNLISHAQGYESRRTRRPPKLSRNSSEAHAVPVSGPVTNLSRVTEEELNAALLSTPEATPRGRPSETKTTEASPLKVILEVDSSNLTDTGWAFQVSPGTWRRIVQNMTTNAIKFTDAGGYYKITLSSKPVHQMSSQTQVVELTFADSGRGMSQDYIHDGIWQAFEQEDHNAQGTGLGLSLVLGLVKDLGGHIHVSSEQDVGTLFTIAIPLVRAPSCDDGPDTSSRTALRGVSYPLLGFDREHENNDDRTNAASDIFRHSIDKACHELGLVKHSSGNDNQSAILNESRASESSSDIIIMTERVALSLEESTWPQSATIVVCDSIKASRRLQANTFGALIVSQPLGPEKLAQSLMLCLRRLKDRKDRLDQSVVAPSEEWMLSESTPSLFGTQKTDSEVHAPQHRAFGQPTDAVTRLPESREQQPILALVVDDNQVNVALLQRYMKKLGYEHCSANNGLEALEAYKSSHNNSRSESLSVPPRTTGSPQVVFMDLMMPVMDGLESTRCIRAYERDVGLKPARIVALTAQESAEAKQEAYRCGVDIFMTKPVRLKELALVLEGLSIEVE